MNYLVTTGEVKITSHLKEGLDGITTALERIADTLEKGSTGKSVEDMRMNISVDAGELTKEILKKNSINAGEIKVTSLKGKDTFMKTTIHINMGASTVSEIKEISDELREALKGYPNAEVVITVDPMRRSRKEKGD